MQENELTDQKKNCIDCGKEWTFTAGNQLFFETKGLRPPLRCPACRKARKSMLELQVRFRDE